MDLNLYLRVLWRFRILVAAGLLLGLALAMFSHVRVSLDDGVSLSYRESEQWASYATIFVTQEGFPLGRSVYDESLPVTPSSGEPADDDSQAYVPRFADPSRFSTYAQLYARLAGSTLLKRQMSRSGPLRGTVSATAGTDPRNPGIILPLVELQALSSTPEDARATADRAARALLAYVAREQRANEIQPSKRVILRMLNEASPPVRIVSRSLTKPVFVFLAVMLAISALAFLLENLRPSVRTAVPVDELPPAESRRSA